MTTYNKYASSKSAAGALETLPSDSGFGTAGQPTTFSSPNSLLLNTHVFPIHSIKSGLNPLVDAAAYVFSLIGKVKLLKSYRHLRKLQKELIIEINRFQEAAKARGYRSEYILVSRYALCATLDDIVSNTSWGGQGQWDNYNLLTVFTPESIQAERFFVILEQIIKDPGKYIDIMELMYICLSLGFKGNFRNSEYSQQQLEQITTSLYKHINAYKGDFNKVLSPPSPKNFKVTSSRQSLSILFIMLVTGIVALSMFIALSYLQDLNAKQIFRELTQIIHPIHDEKNL